MSFQFLSSLVKWILIATIFNSKVIDRIKFEQVERYFFFRFCGIISVKKNVKLLNLTF